MWFKLGGLFLAVSFLALFAFGIVAILLDTSPEISRALAVAIVAVPTVPFLFSISFTIIGVLTAIRNKTAEMTA